MSDDLPAGSDDASDDGSDDAFDGDYWEGRYRRGEATGRRAAGPSLLVEAAELPPGSALDAGCGPGGDALWLAAHGWRVTAVDVSPTALQSARAAAAAAGVADRVDWVQADLTTWTPGERRFDLVTAHYVHVPGAQEALYARLASWVAPGGTLLVVGHAGAHDHTHAHGHGRPAAAQVTVEQVTSCLPGPDWEVVTAEPRTHEVPRPDGSGSVALHDVVVRARRRG